MPPRYAYWTILVDNKPTAFRAREADELLPTLNQLKRKNRDLALKWFARGRLWDSPEAERAAARQPKVVERRGHDWRPGGKHEDPRARFAKKTRNGPRHAAGGATVERRSKSWRDKPGSTAGRRPWGDRPPSGPPREAGQAILPPGTRRNAPKKPDRS